MTKTLKFDNVGMGITLAADWFTLNNKRLWVSFMAASEGRGQARKWSVIATYYDADHKPVRAEAIIAKGFRYEAADLALQSLAA
jgi:hypothetical protein